MLSSVHVDYLICTQISYNFHWRSGFIGPNHPIQTLNAFVQFNEQRKFLLRKVVNVGDNASLLEGSLAMCGRSRSSGNVTSIDTCLLTKPFKGIPDSITGQQGPDSYPHWLGREHRVEGGRHVEENNVSNYSQRTVQLARGWEQWVLSDMVRECLHYQLIFVLSYATWCAGHQREEVCVQLPQSRLKVRVLTCDTVGL